MRIAIMELYCGGSGKPGFYNSQEVGLARAYAQLGHEVFILLPQKKGKEKEWQEVTEQIHICLLPAKCLGVHSFYQLGILKELGIELVHLDADSQMYAPHVMRFCLKHHIPFYNYVGTVYSDSDNVLKKAVLRLVSERNIRMFRKHRTFVKTEAVKRQLERKQVSGVRVVPVGLDTEVIPDIQGTKEELRESLGLPQDKKLLLFVGRLEAYKRPMDALQLLSRLPGEYYLVMIGSGSMQRQVQEKIKSSNLQQRVLYIERIQNKDIHAYYRAADCFVNFNEKEIFGMSVLEAMYQGCPVVARHAPGTDTMVKDGETGYLCDNIEQMFEFVQKTGEPMGEKAKERVQKCFLWPAAAAAFLKER